MFTNNIPQISSPPLKRNRKKKEERVENTGRGGGQAGMDDGSRVRGSGRRGEAAFLTGPICKSVPGCWILINVLVTRKRAGDAII